MKIAICDDDKEFSNWLYKYLNVLSGSIKEKCIIDTYNDPSSLKKVLLNNEDVYEVIILDVDMGEISGLDIASILHDQHSDVLIIFLSAYSNYVYEAIKYTPFRYVRKDKLKIELNEAFEAAYRNLEDNKEQFYFCRNRTEIIKIKISKILYFDMCERKVRFSLTDGNCYTEKTTISNVMDKLPLDNFCQIHSGIVVNMKYIISYNKTVVKISNGEELPISRYRFKKFERKFLEFIGEKI